MGIQIPSLAEINDLIRNVQNLILGQQALLAGQQDLSARLGRIEEELKTMPTKADFDNLCSQIDAATNSIATRLQKLNDQITQLQNAGGISADDATALQSKLQAEIATLQGLGSDPNNPVPAATPTPA